VIKKELEKKTNSTLDYFDCLINNSIELDKDIEGVGKKGQIIFPSRGHCLGMGNELTTLIQCVIAKMIRDTLGFDSNKVKVDTWNDDFRAIGELSSLESWMVLDIDYCERLGWVIKDEATAILKGASVFLEEYLIADEEIDYSKFIRESCSITNIEFCQNITEAKILGRSIYSSCSFLECEGISKQFVRTVFNWGYEFYREEVIESEKFGGWFQSKYLYHDESCIGNKFFSMPPITLMKAIKAEEEEVELKQLKSLSHKKFIKKKLKNSKKLSISERLLCPVGDFLIHNELDLANKISDALSFRRQKNFYYKKLHSQRSKKFKERTPPLTHGNILSYLAKRDLESLYAIPLEFIKDLEYGKMTTEYIRCCNPRNYITESLYGNIELQHKFLTTRDLCTDEDKLRLFLSCKLNPNAFSDEIEIIRNKEFISCLDKYEMNSMISSTYYLSEYGGYPRNLYDDIILPDRYKEFDLEGIDIILDQVIKEYPKGLSPEDSLIMEEFISRNGNRDLIYEATNFILERQEEYSFKVRLRRGADTVMQLYAIETNASRETEEKEESVLDNPRTDSAIFDKELDYLDNDLFDFIEMQEEESDSYMSSDESEADEDFTPHYEFTLDFG